MLNWTDIKAGVAGFISGNTGLFLADISFDWKLRLVEYAFNIGGGIVSAVIFTSTGILVKRFWEKQFNNK